MALQKLFMASNKKKYVNELCTKGSFYLYKNNMYAFIKIISPQY